MSDLAQSRTSEAAFADWPDLRKRAGGVPRRAGDRRAQLAVGLDDLRAAVGPRDPHPRQPARAGRRA